MSRKKKVNKEFEFGVVTYDNELNSESTEDSNIGERVSTSKGKITNIENNSIWIEINSYGYIIKDTIIESWMKKGINLNVSHLGEPGHKGFKILKVQQ